MKLEVPTKIFVTNVNLNHIEKHQKNKIYN